MDGRAFIRYLDRENIFCQSGFINKLKFPLKVLKSSYKNLEALRSVDLYQRAFKDYRLFQSFFPESSFQNSISEESKA